MYYPATFEKDDMGLYTVSFRDIPEALTCGDNYEDAVLMAQDCLLTALDFYFDDKRQVPAPSKCKVNDVLIKLPSSAWAKVLLLNEMIAQKIGQSELARRLHVQKQQVTRLTDLHHSSKIDLIEKALQVMGKELHLSI